MVVKKQQRKTPKRKRAARPVEDERFRLVVESAPNAMVLIDALGKIVLINNTTETLFGYKRKDLIGKKVEILIPDRFKANHPTFRTNFFSAPVARSMGAGRDLFAMRKDGSEFPVEIGLNPLDTPEGPMVLAAIIDISERKRVEERFRMVVESAPYAMILVNEEGKIILINSETEKLFHYSRNQLIGCDLEILIPERFRTGHPRLRQTFHSKPKMRSMGQGRDLFALRRDGTEFPVEIRLNPIQSPEGHMVLASITDVTERKTQEANKLKSEFLANMSHELRTPLNAVLGFSELLIDKKIGPLNDKQLEYMQDIHSSGSHLLNLINNVLDLSKIEAGKVELRLEKFNLAEIVEGLIKTIIPLAEKKNIAVTTQLSKDLGNVTLDKHKFRQILYNLLSNAIKFNNPGGTVSVRSSRINESTFSITVADDGIGISEEDQKRLFIPFMQVDTSTTRKHEGTGLGLALTKNLIELHGGKIELNSRASQGASFTVTMPVSLKEPPPHE